MAKRKIIGIRIGIRLGLSIFCGASIALTMVSCASQTTPHAPQVASSPKIEIYCDFRCPFCARLFRRLVEIKAVRGSSIEYSLLNVKAHIGAESLSLYYEAASLLYPNQRESVLYDLFRFRDQTTAPKIDSFLKAYSIVRGFDHEAILRETNSRDVRLAVDEPERKAMANKVNNTPTVFVDGKLLEPMEPEQVADHLHKISRK